jgi:SAM-dependent methyltransferase
VRSRVLPGSQAARGAGGRFGARGLPTGRSRRTSRPDVGCGVGAFLRLVTERDAKAYGLDASEALLGLGRTRVPEADLRVGDMEAPPYEDDTFDLVTGFNSFFFANDWRATALRTAATDCTTSSIS